MKTIKTRLISSAVLYGIFVASASAVAIGARHDLRYYVLIPFLLAYMLLPRRQFAAEVGEEEARKMNLSLSYLRVAYFVVAAFILIALPKIL